MEVQQNILPLNVDYYKETLYHKSFSLCLIQKEEEEGKLRGIKICRGDPSISHFLYTNDILIMCHVNVENVKAIFRVLEKYHD